MNHFSILVVDDDIQTLDLVATVLAAPDRTIFKFNNPAQALRETEDHLIDIVISDFRMPQMTGLDVLKEMKRRAYDTDVILMTAFGEIEVAVQAIKHGASDFLTKPLRVPELTSVVNKLLEFRSMQRRLKDLSGGDIAPVGTGELIQRLVTVANMVAETDSTVLILGETGVGKEVLANYIQRHSLRAAGPFVKVNCAALPETLLESELFGHEKGAFTGAAERRIGRFERAHRGTLFLDEIGELPQSVQVKLLRVLQNREVERIGGNQSIPCDFRLICATHQEIEVQTETGKFRKDLFYRINVVPLEVPPLRKRVEDIPALACHFLQRARSKIGQGPTEIHPDALEKIKAYPWPGNVRELENVIERACVLSTSSVLMPGAITLKTSCGIVPRTVPETLPLHVSAASTTSSAPESAVGNAVPSGALSSEWGQQQAPWDESIENPLEEAEKLTLRMVLQRHNWNFNRAAHSLKLSRSTLYAKADRYGIKRS